MGLFSSIGKLGSSLFEGATGVLGSIGGFLGSGTGQALGGLLDTGADIAGGLFSANQAFQQNKELMKYQHDLNLDAYGQRHQLEVKDLRAAGLNPILSANSGASVAGTGLNSAMSMADQSSKLSTGSQARALAELNRAQIAQTASQVNLNQTASYRNNAEADALTRNADANMVRALADAGLARQRTINEKLYPSNQPTLFKYINSAKPYFGSYQRSQSGNYSYSD